MKNAFFVFMLSACFGTFLGAQRLDDVDFKHTYLQVPMVPLQGSFKTYSVVIKPNGVNFGKMGMIESAMKENFFSLESYQYVKEGGDFVILVTLDGNHFVSKTLKKSEVTEGEGAAAKKVTYYSYEVLMRTPISYAIYDGERQLMIEKVVSSYERTFKGTFGKATSTQNLDKEWNNAGDATVEGWVKADFADQMKNLHGHLKRSYDTYTVTKERRFLTMKNADKIGYQEMADAVLKLKPVVEGATVDNPLTLASFGDQIGMWEKALANANPMDKKEGFAFQMAAFNLAMANALTGNFEVATAMAERIGETGRKEYIANPVNEVIKDLQARAKANESIPSTYVGKFNPEAHAIFMSEHKPIQLNPSVTTTRESLPDYVVLLATKDTLTGMITSDFKTVRELKSFQGLWIEGIMDGELKKRYVKVEEMSVMRKNSVVLRPILVGLGIIGVITLQETLYASDDLALMKGHEGEGDGSFFLLHMVLDKKGESDLKVYALNDGLAFMNFNKGIAGKFEDCPNIVEKANNKGYEKNETSLRTLVDDYKACKQ